MPGEVPLSELSYWRVVHNAHRGLQTSQQLVVEWLESSFGSHSARDIARIWPGYGLTSVHLVQARCYKRCCESGAREKSGLLGLSPSPVVNVMWTPCGQQNEDQAQKG